MFRRLMFIVTMMFIPTLVSAFPGKGALRVTGRVCVSLGRGVRTAVNYTVSSPVTVNRGGSCGASFGITYHPNRGCTETVYEGGVLRTNNMNFRMVIESDRPVMSIMARTATGWHQPWNNPRVIASEQRRTIELPFHPDVRLTQEVLTIVVQYCDARNAPDGEPQLYEYTIDRSPR